MVHTPTEPIRPLTWEATHQSPVEVLHTRDLRRRFTPEFLSVVERLEFHVVLIGDAGRGIHEIDFVDTEIAPRRVAHITPGQVQRWRVDERFDAIVVLFREAPADLSPTWRLGPSTHDLDDNCWASLHDLFRLHDEFDRRVEDQRAHTAAMRSLRDLLFVNLGLHEERGPERSTLPPAYVGFRDDLETDLSVASTMQDRARRIGYSARTISRACLDVSNRTAKQLFDERIVLEARRLLSQPTATSSQVAATLGFSEPTNFAKFFRRLTGQTPSDWVDSVRS